MHLVAAASTRYGAWAWLTEEAEESTTRLGDRRGSSDHCSQRFLKTALRLIAARGNQLGAIIESATDGSSKTIIEDLGERGRRGIPMENFLREAHSVEHIVGIIAIVDRDSSPAKARIILCHRREYMSADRLAGITDRDRNLDARIEDFASIRPRLMRVPPHIERLGCAANVYRDRFERELRIGRCFRRITFLGYCIFGGICCFGCEIDLRRSIGFGSVEFRCYLGGFGSGPKFLFFGAPFRLIGLRGHESPFRPSRRWHQLQP